MQVALDPNAVRVGRVNGRYFRENFAQGGFDLAQVIPELVTNADAAIAAAGRPRGRIELGFGPADPNFVADWKQELRALRVRGLPVWHHEIRCTDNGEGMDADTVDRRLGALGVTPEQIGQRGLFGRGLRDVWLAQGGGRLEAVRGGRAVETWFFPAPGDEPFAFVHVRDEQADQTFRRAIGLSGSGTRVTVPLIDRRLPANGRLRALVSQLVQLRPVLEDPEREVWLELPGQSAQLVSFPTPEPDSERPLLADVGVDLGSGASARIVVRRAAEPIPLTPLRATRRGGLVIRSGRAAHEVTHVGYEGRPGARHLFGEVICEALETVQRAALDSRRPQLVVKADRSGLNEHHPLVRRLYAAIDQVLRPIVEAEERRATAQVLSAGRAVKARDEVGLREINDALRAVFDAPGSTGFGRGGQPTDRAPIDNVSAERAADGSGQAASDSPPEDPQPVAPIRFKQPLIRLHPGEQRNISLLFDPITVRPGTPVVVAADRGLSFKIWPEAKVPEPNRSGWSRLTGSLRARATVDPGVTLGVVAEAAGYPADLAVVVVRHHGSGWVREIARKDEDSQVEAYFDPDTGTVTVFEGRPEFRALERAARRSGLPRSRVREYLPLRMLEVEAAANAVYAWAAEQILEHRFAGHSPLQPAEHAQAARLEAQGLRHRFHERLMRAFLDPEVFDGGVRIKPAAESSRQGSLLDQII